MKYDMNIPNDIRSRILDALLPKPRDMASNPSNFCFDDTVTIWMDVDASAKVKFAASRLVKLMNEEFHIELPVGSCEFPSKYMITIGSKPGNMCELNHKFSKISLCHEEYIIEIDENNVVLNASGSSGILWAAMTLRQLLVRHDGMLLALGVSLKDGPHYPFRGFMIDAARAPISMADMKRIVRICSAFKLNHLIFREGDDEFNAVRYNTNKLGWENPYSFTMAEMAEFIEYADMYGVTIVPEIESLGHSAAKAISYPHLIEGGYHHDYNGLCSHLRKAFLRPCNPEAIELLSSMYDEWLNITKAPYIHLGMDEVAADADLREKHLVKLIEVLQTVARKHARQVKPIIWSDATEVKPHKTVPAIRCIWGYEEHGEVGFDNSHLVSQGIDVFLQDGCKQAIILAGGSGSKHTPYSKGTYEDALHNILSWARIGAKADNCLGLLAVQWAGNMLDDWLPDFLAVADWGWTVPERNVEIKLSIQQMFSHLSRLGDYNNPAIRSEYNPAWYGIWLKGQDFHRDILHECRQLSLIEHGYRTIKSS